MRSPVLFLVFNRPDTTRRVFQAIRDARPPRLYIAADGAREAKQGERELCDEVRAIALQVDWPCEVHTLFRDTNLGCKNGVSSGVTWFFEHEPEGIILEDDVLPESTFFRFCDELLERFRNDVRVAAITGNNLIAHEFKIKDSYFFSRYPHIWGWASWRRAWNKYDVAMKNWPEWRDMGGLRKTWDGGRFLESYWRHYFGSTFEGKIDTWDYQWFFACWYTGGLTIVPNTNQTRNLGYGAGATHTTGDEPPAVRLSRARPLTFPLIHPATVERSTKADSVIDAKVFGVNALSTLKRGIRSVPVFERYILFFKSLGRIFSSLRIKTG
ncbi:MAG: glycosyltransferase family 2 protein [Pseudomonadota bacterium]|nr:glycosyltransferase family 2 protein [Pseudomonadota bacterium]